jgi:membrane-bound lytic murein transglycosylase D
VRITSLIVVSLMLPTPAAFADIPVVSYPMLSSASVRQQTPFDDLRAEFKLTIPDNDKQIEYWRKYYLADRYHLNIVANNMLPFIPIILKKIKEKKLPAELAIIPMVESCYRVNEGSHKGAIGLWQINAITAVEFELVDEWNYDARLDVLATTDAA